MIEVRSICKSFNNVNVLDNVNAMFEPGKVNLIIGQSGSGKTVLLKTIVGLHVPDSGAVLYSNRDFTAMSTGKKREIRKEIGMLFQGSALFDWATVEQNVRFPLDFFTDWTLREKQRRVLFCLDRVQLTHASRLMPGELSGGMQKRVAIARAIALNPKYLFCDEPNSGLDPQTSSVIDSLIMELTKEFDMTTIVNTHDLNSVLAIGETIIFIKSGQKWWEGTRDSILETSNPELRQYLLASEVLRKANLIGGNG
jgi:phospholipid/cholesterol/gamma-HCH transport system ATP-binding protein